MSGAARGARLFLDADMGSAETLARGAQRAVVFSAQHPEREGSNQDAAAVLDWGADSLVLAVADGVGGQPGGASAAQVAVECLARAAAAAWDADESQVRSGILDAIEAANREVLERGAGAATTLAVAQLSPAGLRPIHVGDSAICVVGQRGKLKLQTVSHSPVGYAVESGLLDEDEALHHDERHLVSNAVGSRDMRTEVGSPLRLAPRDTVLLATDGLLDNLATEEILETIRKGPLERAAAALARTARQRMTAPATGEPSKPDDLTFILWRQA